MDKKLPTILKKKIIASSKLFKIESLDIQFANQTKVTYERIATNDRGAVLVVALNTKNQLVMIKEYYCGTERYELAFVKGKIDDNETPEQAAIRECQEEIGFKPNKIKYLKNISTSPSYMASSIHVLLAEDLHAAKLEGDEPEPIEVVYWNIDKYKELMNSSEFREGRSYAGLMLALCELNKLS